VTMTSVIPAGFKVPGVYLKVTLGAGARAAGDSAKVVVLFANKTAAGVGSLETELDIFSEDDAKSWGGPGSELHLGAKAALEANPGVTLKAMLVTAAGTAATGTIVLATVPTAAGTIYVDCTGGNQIEVPYEAGESLAAIGARLEIAMDAVADWPITSAFAVATLTATAKNTGPRGNFIMLRARTTPGTGLTATGPVTGYLTGGATSDEPQTSLDVQTAYRRAFLVAPYSDSTQLAKFKTHVDAQEEPLAGNRKQVVFGSLDTLANCTTLAVTLNFPRMQCVWQEGSDQTPFMMAAAVASMRSIMEADDPACIYDGVIVPGLKPHYSAANKPNLTELNAALNNGITPLGSVGSGEVAIVRSVTTKSQENSLPDYRVLDTSKVTVPDYIADVLELAFPDRFPGYKASNDPAEGKQPPPGVVTPSMCNDLIFEVLNAAEGNGTDGMASGADDGEDAEFQPVIVKGGLLEIGSVARNRRSVITELSQIDKGRFNHSIPVDVIEGYHQSGIDVRQVA
jgi:phage tail sheath gpL-like